MRFAFVSLLFLLSFSKAEFVLKSIQELRNEATVRQNYEESCGAASMANLLNLFSFKLFKEQDILNFLNHKTDMLSFFELKDLAIKMEYESEAYKLSRDEFSNLSMPAIVKVQKDPRFPHFIVVIPIKGDFIRIIDPNFGSYISSKDEFYSIWDIDKQGGYVLIVLPKDMNFLSIKNEIFFKDYHSDKTKF